MAILNPPSGPVYVSSTDIAEAERRAAELEVPAPTFVTVSPEDRVAELRVGEIENIPTARLAIQESVNKINELIRKEPGTWNYRGDWVDIVKYKAYDVVIFDDRTWLALLDSLNEEPAEASLFWTALTGATGGGGGGGGITTDILARYVASGSAPMLLSPDTVLEQIVPGVTISFTLTAAKTVGIWMRLEFTSFGGASRFLIKENGVKVWPEYGTQANWIQSSGDGSLFFLAEALHIKTLPIGTYTYTVWEAASGSLAGKTYYNRLLEARDYT